MAEAPEPNNPMGQRVSITWWRELNPRSHRVNPRHRSRERDRSAGSGPGRVTGGRTFPQMLGDQPREDDEPALIGVCPAVVGAIAGDEVQLSLLRGTKDVLERG